MVPCGNSVLGVPLSGVEHGRELVVCDAHGARHQGFEIIGPCDGSWIGHVSADADPGEHLGRRVMHGDIRGRGLFRIKEPDAHPTRCHHQTAAICECANGQDGG